MKIAYSNLKKGEVKIKVENTDDLWYISHIIEIGDAIKGKTERKVKIGEEGERKARVTRKLVFLKLKVDKVELKGDNLRIGGIILEGPDDIAKGSHHTFTIDEESIKNTLTIIKEKWLKYQLDRLKEASQQRVSKTLICVFDREDASFALMKKYGFDILSEIKGEVEKKAEIKQAKGQFYKEVITVLEKYVDKYKIETAVLASPAFFKEDLMKQLTNSELKKKIILATCNNVGRNGVLEVLKRPEVKEVLKQDRIAKEVRLVEQLFEEISKNNLAAYGFKETKMAAEAGAVAILLVADGYISKTRENNKYGQLDSLMKNVDSSKGEIHIISSEHEAGKKLDGLGGIGAVLRYKLNY